MKKYDVIIIGAGPAGLSCANTLQTSGKSVLVLEKNKEIGPKVCAGGLTTKIKSTGLSLNQGEILFSAMKVHGDNCLGIVTGTTPFIATIDRGRLGKIMLDKISKQIEIKKEVRVISINNSYIEVNNQKIGFDYLVGADGSTSYVRKFLKLDTKKYLMALQYIIPEKYKDLEVFFDASLFGSGYAWIFPHKDYTSVGCCQDIRYVKNPSFKQNFASWLNQIFKYF